MGHSNNLASHDLWGVAAIKVCSKRAHGESCATLASMGAFPMPELSFSNQREGLNTVLPSAL